MLIYRQTLSWQLIMQGFHWEMSVSGNSTYTVYTVPPPSLYTPTPPAQLSPDGGEGGGARTSCCLRPLVLLAVANLSDGCVVCEFAAS